MGYAFDAEAFLGNLDLSHPGLSGVASASSKEAALAAAASHFRSRRSPRAFLAPEDKDAIVRVVRDRFPAEADADRDTAEHVMRHDFWFRHRWDMELTQAPASLGETIDWRAAVGGDIEFNTMLTRHRYFQDFGRTYWMTGDERYAAAWRDLLLSFNEDFDDDIVVTGTRMSPLQAGIRLGNWAKSFDCMLASPSLSDVDLCRIVDAFRRQAHHLFFRDAAHNYKSNHTNFQYAGLYLAALLFPEFREKAAWLEKARPALVKTLGIQVLESGFQYEHSPMYHVEVILPLLDLLIVARRNGVELPPEVPATLERLFDALLQVLGPDRRIPTIGDSDDFDAHDIMTAGALLFRRGDFKFFGYERLDYENLWLFGRSAIEEYEKIEAEQPAGTSSAIVDAAWIAMRSSWGAARDQLLFTVPVRYYGGHLHADPLSVTGHFEGRLALTDCGRFTYLDVYTDGEKWRRYFKSTASHSTVSVDGEDTWRYVDEWGWEPPPSGKLLAWFESPAVEHAAGSHDGYLRLSDPVAHRRDVVYVRPDYWIVVDRLDAKEDHVYRQYWQTGTAQVSLDERSGIARVSVGGMETLGLLPDPARRRKTALEPWQVSREFNLREPGHHVVCERTGDSLFFPALLVPARGGKLVLPKVARRGSEKAMALVAEFPGGTDVLFVSREPGRTADAGGIETDARLALVRLAADGKVASFYLCEGTRLSYRKRELAVLAERPGRLSALYGGGRVEVVGDGRESGIRILFQGGGLVSLDGRTAAFARSGDLMTISR